MLQDAEAGGFALVVVSGFRTAEKQQSILDDKIAYYEGQGLSAADARTEAARWVAAPGYSEHQLGLAADINTAGEGPTGADAYAWLAKRRGAMALPRYPEDKTELTGTAYEPWHFVRGEEAAGRSRSGLASGILPDRKEYENGRAAKRKLCSAPVILCGRREGAEVKPSSTW